MWNGDIQSGYSTQWALNPSVYQNMPNEQVDWATLAQQWIKMKETFPVDQVPPAPPPPSIKAEIEAGEAPMDMSKDEISPSTSASASQDGSNWGSWNNWQQWNSWGWSGSTGNSTTIPPDKTATAPPYQYPPPPAAASTYTAEITTPTTFDYNHGATVPDNFGQQGYWSGGPAPFVRNKSSDWRADIRAPTSRRLSNKVEELEPDPNTFLDAAKRKQLPAWIREGLEKMEREKQKKLEREKQLKEREEEMAKRQQEVEKAIELGIPVKSKFETDSEDSEKELEEVPVKPRRSRFDATSSSPVLPKPVNSNSSPPPIKRKSRDELMQEVMQKVRHTLTEILMSVTNEEMRRIGEEVLAEFRSKASATPLRKTPALTSLTGKLGLGIYDSDSQNSSESEEEQPAPKKNPRIDTDEEIRERINRKKQEFARIERDIEYQVEQQEEKEREREKNSQIEDQVEDPPSEITNKGQVEHKLTYPGPRLELKVEEPTEETIKHHEKNSSGFFTPERPHKAYKESSEDDSDRSTSKSDSSSSTTSSSYHASYKKSSKKRKESRSSKRKRKRSSSRSSDRRKSSHRKSSHRYEHKRSYDRSRSRSRSRGYDDYRHKRSRSPSYRRHSSESSYKHSRRHHSYSRSPDYSRGKKSSHRSRD